MSKYTPLRALLSGAGESEIEMSFEEIERALGFQLPRSARVHRPWWSNEGGGTHVQARAWMGAGYQVWDVDLARQRTLFKRRGAGAPVDPAIPRGPGSPGHPPDDVIHVDRNALSPAARRLLADYSGEAGQDEGAAVVRALHEAAKARRARFVSVAAAHAPKVADDSVDLIREDRDAR